MTTITAETRQEHSSALRWGVNLMTLAALAFVGYAVIFFVLNFTDSFLELGIGREQVASGKAEIKAFDNDLYHYISHLHITVSGFIASTGLAVAALAWSESDAATSGPGRQQSRRPCSAWGSPCPRTTRGASPRLATSGWSTWQRRYSSSAPCCRARRCWTSKSDEQQRPNALDRSPGGILRGGGVPPHAQDPREANRADRAHGGEGAARTVRSRVALRSSTAQGSAMNSWA